MAELRIELPDKLHEIVCKVSEQNDIPIDELIAVSLASKLYRMIPDPYLEERARGATGEGLLKVLSQVPDVPADDHDQL